MVVGLKNKWLFIANCMLLIALGVFASGFLSTPILANDGNSSIFTVNPANGLTMDSTSGKFEFDATKNSIKVGSKEWKIDEGTFFLGIFNGNRPITLQSLTDLGDRLDTKATIICTQKTAPPYSKGVFLRQVIIHLYD